MLINYNVYRDKITKRILQKQTKTKKSIAQVFNNVKMVAKDCKKCEFFLRNIE